MTRDQAYCEVEKLVKGIGGSMEWHPGGKGGGGRWELTLHGRSATIPCHNSNVNALDSLYEPKVPNPKTWQDYERNAPLVKGAFWKLVEADFWERSSLS